MQTNGNEDSCQKSADALVEQDSYLVNKGYIRHVIEINKRDAWEKKEGQDDDLTELLKCRESWRKQKE